MKKITALLLLIFTCLNTSAQKDQTKKYAVIAYFSADSATVNKYDYSKITHVIYSFGHTDSSGHFTANTYKDSSTIQALQHLKNKYPGIKILISMGGWSACAPCSDVFNDLQKTQLFVNGITKYVSDFKLDGIDLDWEYPAVENYPGHTYRSEDKQNFTRLIKMLRTKMGTKKTLSFAAGGFIKYMTDAVEWAKIEPYIDYVNLMTYDLVGGYSTVTGHHTPVFSIADKEESLARAVQYFEKINFPLHKLIAGAAFTHAPGAM